MVLVGFCLMSSVPGRSQDASPAAVGGDASLHPGIELLQKREYANAREEFLRMTQAHPKSSEAFFYLGITEVGLGNLPGAENALRQSLLLNPRSINTLYNLGVVLLDEKKPAEAVGLLEEASKLAIPEPALSVNLVRAYLALGRNEDAFRVAESASKRDPNSVALQVELGKCLLAHGGANRAAAYLEKANSLAPLQPEIVLPLAEAYFQQHNLGLARDVLEQIAPKAQDIAEYHYMLAKSSFLSGQKESTLQQMASALRIKPEDPVYLLTLGRYYQKYGDQKSALSFMYQAEKIAPDLAEVPYSIAVTYFILDDYDTATKFLQRAVKLDAGFDRAIFLLGSIKSSQGEDARGEALLSEAVTMKPTNPFYLTTYGIFLVSQNRVSEALDLFHRALDVFPNYALPHYQIGRAQARLGQPADARVELEKAISLQPDLHEAWYHLAQTYRKLGMKEKADEALAIFKTYDAAEGTERQEMLKEAGRAIQASP